MEDRVRKVNVEALSLERADELSKQISAKVIQLEKEALEKINKILNVYGMAATMSVEIRKLEEK